MNSLKSAFWIIQCFLLSENSEKPDWNKLKNEKKALREKRRAAQKNADNYEVSIEAKKILEGIRSRKCPAAEQVKQLEKLHFLLKGKLLSVSTCIHLPIIFVDNNYQCLK